MSRKSPLTLALEAKVAALEKECSRLRHAITETIPMTTPDSTEPPAVQFDGNKHYRIYIVWTIGTYANGVRLLDIRAVTTTPMQATMFSKMLRRDKQPGERWERIVIEPRVANHLYGETWREMMVNTGRM